MTVSVSNFSHERCFGSCITEHRIVELMLIEKRVLLKSRTEFVLPVIQAVLRYLFVLRKRVYFYKHYLICCLFDYQEKGVSDSRTQDYRTCDKHTSQLGFPRNEFSKNIYALLFYQLLSQITGTFRILQIFLQENPNKNVFRSCKQSPKSDQFLFSYGYGIPSLVEDQ